MSSIGILRMDMKQCRWVFLIITAYVTYLFFADKPYITIPLPGSKENDVQIHTQALIFMQLIPCVLFSLLASIQFEETFRPSGRDYLQSLHISKLVLLLLRPLLTVLVLTILFLPLSMHTASLMTLSAAENNGFLPANVLPPVIYWRFLYFQSVPMIVFCYFATMFTELLCCSKHATMILMLTWFGFKIAGFYRYLGPISLFQNTLQNFTPQDGIQLNSVAAIIYSGFIQCFVLFSYRRARLMH